jgi:hypothetical protein
VTVLAVVTLIFGGVTLVGVGYAAYDLILAVTAGDLGHSTVADVLDIRGLHAVVNYLDQQVPNYSTIMATLLVLWSVLGLVLIVAAFGLMTMKRWAKATCLVAGLLFLVTTGGNLAFQLGSVSPTLVNYQLLNETIRRRGRPRRSSSILGAGLSAIAPARTSCRLTRARSCRRRTISSPSCSACSSASTVLCC